MFLIFLLLNLSRPVHSKEVLEFKCIVDKEFSIGISMIDKASPSITAYYKKNSIAQCLYENIESQMFKRGSHSQENIWKLRQKKCDYYGDKANSKIQLLDLVTFKQSIDLQSGFFKVLRNKQPLFCTAK